MEPDAIFVAQNLLDKNRRVVYARSTHWETLVTFGWEFGIWEVKYKDDDFLYCFAIVEDENGWRRATTEEICDSGIYRRQAPSTVI